MKHRQKEREKDSYEEISILAVFSEDGNYQDICLSPRKTGEKYISSTYYLDE